MSESRILSELIYSASNLLILYHDGIISAANKQKSTNKQHTGNNNNDNKRLQQVKILLTTLEFCEVFIELSVERFKGKRAKWSMITIIQLIKCAGRLFLLRHSNNCMVKMPPIPFLNRTAEKQQENEKANKMVVVNQSSLSFQLKRSGRIVRKVEGAPPLRFRDFNLTTETDPSEKTPQKLAKKLLTAEYMYILKPLVHLAAIYMNGGNTRHWTPYFMSLGLDLSSLQIIYANRQQLNKEQRRELSERCLRLLLYLVRSPFYDRYTHKRLQSLFQVLGHVPLLRLFTNALKDYMSIWQNTYFQIWHS